MSRTTIPKTDPRHDPWGTERNGGYGGFDITCVIGHVEVGPNGDENPQIAAFKMIAAHDTEGVFQFPMYNGRRCSVTVEYEAEPEDPSDYDPLNGSR